MAMINELNEPSGCGKKLGVLTWSVLNHYVVREFHKHVSSTPEKAHLLSPDTNQYDELYACLQKVNSNLIGDLEFIIKKVSNDNVDPSWYISSSFISLMALLSINVSKSGLGYPFSESHLKDNREDRLYSNLVSVNPTGVPPAAVTDVNGNAVQQSIFPRVDSRHKLTGKVEGSTQSLTPLSSAFTKKKDESTTTEETIPSSGECGAMMSILNTFKEDRRNSFNSSSTSNPASEYEAEGTVPMTTNSSLYTSIIPDLSCQNDQATPLFKEDVLNSSENDDRSPSPPVNPSPSSGDLYRAARGKFAYRVNEEKNDSRGFGHDITDDDATAKSFKSENEWNGDEEGEWEGEDSDEDYFGFDSDNDIDNIDDLGVDMSNMSPNLLASLGVHVDKEIETDWTPPSHTGLSNSARIIQ